MKLPIAEYRPAPHKPLHVETVNPVVFPNEPASHNPEQEAVVNPVIEPYVVTGQEVQLPAPPNEYLPSGHAAVQLPSI
jgi:hypothetical protein